MTTFRKRNYKWQVQVRRAHLGSISQTFNQKQDALQWAREKEIELQQCSIKFKRDKFPTLSDLIDRYIKKVSINKRGYDFERYCFNNILRSKNTPVLNLEFSLFFGVILTVNLWFITSKLLYLLFL